MKRLTKTVVILLLFLGCFFVALGFNTIDQMIIRYKYYDDWRKLETWEMSWFWKPYWWNIYILSILMLVAGGGMLCADAVIIWLA